MGNYRTKPEEVEAIQYSGSASKPFSETLPDWVWVALSTGVLRFTALGVNIEYNGLSENVMPNDWLVLSNDSVIRACEDKVFRQYYTPYRQRRTKAEIDAERVSIEAERVAEAVLLAAAFPEAFPEATNVVAA